MYNLKITDKKILLILLFFIIVTIFLWSSVLADNKKDLKIFFYDVGQGDAIHIRNSENQDILIDGGPDSKIIDKLDQNLPFYDQKIELIILTHPHADHITGLIHVLKKYKVEKVLQTDIGYDSNIFSEWHNLLKEEQVEELMAKSGQIIKLGEANLYVLFPNLSYNNKEIKNLNNASVVSKLIYGNSSFLFTGDAEKEVEKELLDKFSKDILASSLLKIGHHGSNTATTEEFLSQVSPLYAVISVGKGNKFGHPHQETISEINNLDIKLFRTDEDGDVKCVSDGEVIDCNKL